MWLPACVTKREAESQRTSSHGTLATLMSPTGGGSKSSLMACRSLWDAQLRLMGCCVAGGLHWSAGILSYCGDEEALVVEVVEVGGRSEETRIFLSLLARANAK